MSTVDVAALADRLDLRLRERAVPERAEQERAYLKSSLVHYGDSVPAIRAAVKETLPPLVGPSGQGGLSHDEVVGLAALLWDEPAAAPVHERRMAAVEVLAAGSDRLSPGDLRTVERFVREARTWALVDGLAASVAGAIVDRADPADPVVAETLDAWAVDEDFWVRRSALLAHLPGLRRGAGDPDRFLRYADAMLDEREFFIRKAIGWVLRDTARKRPGLVLDWLLPRAGRASTVTWREAVKPMDPQQRAELERARLEQR